MEELTINDSFPDDKLFALIGKETPWYAYFVNYLATGVLPPNLYYKCNKKFFSNLKHYYCDEPLLFKRGTDGFFWRCIPQEEIESVMTHFHASVYGGLVSIDKNVSEILQVDLYWPTLFKNIYAFIKKFDQCQCTGVISKEK